MATKTRDTAPSTQAPPAPQPPAQLPSTAPPGFAIPEKRSGLLGVTS
ncbi:MAG: hypothetical protein ACYCUM_12525 [Solirubrobacteraceae bacterium]